MRVFFKLMGGNLPKKQTLGSAGYDVFACGDYLLRADGVVLVKLGFSMSFSFGYEAQIRSRSGLALKEQIVVLNAPGTIDSDYRDEVGVILKNFSSKDFVIKDGDRVAQMVFAKVESPEIIVSEVLPDLSGSSRFGGFGSTGI